MNERARKYEALMLRRLASVGQAHCAAALSCSESTISRFQSEQLGRLCQLVEVLGLKVVPAEMKCYRPEDIDPYIQIAKQHMQRINGAESLQWEEGEL